ncbi:AMP-binding protein [Nostoc sp. WHI]|uniref:AMP-binding protein n=1 Tax=Nostoc sp. WHI TaxID=2650611 RepID=UPI001E50C84E|nr:AMP-binding protein [Nostoc sp. WHI]
MNLFEILAGEDNHPSLITADGRSLTHKQLRDNVVELVSQLSSFGLEKGERLAIAMTNGSPMAITFLAAALCGTAAPLNPKYCDMILTPYINAIYASVKLLEATKVTSLPIQNPHT